MMGENAPSSWRSFVSSDDHVLNSLDSEDFTAFPAFNESESSSPSDNLHARMLHGHHVASLLGSGDGE